MKRSRAFWIGFPLVAVCGAAVWIALLRPPLRDPDAAHFPWFEDVTQRSGIQFVQESGPPEKFFMPAIMGSGAALFDFDKDGRLDVLLVQQGGAGSKFKNQLFRQKADGSFEDVSAGSGLDVDGTATGVAVGDVNNDGLPDVAIGEYGGIRLFLNEGGGKFRETTAEAGLSNPAWASSIAFVDYDRDGWLDLVVVNYVDYDPSLTCTASNGAPDYCNPKNFRGSVTRLFRNRGPQPGSKAARFEDVTAVAGFAKAPGPGLGVLCADFNGDGWPDVFVANDGKPNHLWINRKNGTFVEEAAIRGVANNCMGQAQAGMGIAWGDVDGDGLLDLFVTHVKYETHTLWKQGPRGRFTDVTGQAGLTMPRWQGTGFGVAFADLDHDGALDLAVANGHIARQDPPVAPGLGPHWGLYGDRNQLFRNDGSGRFRDVSEKNPEFCGTFNIARGLAYGDLDGDGAVDMLVTNVAAPARVYRNVAPKKGHWAIVETRLPSPRDPSDPKLDRDAYGATVAVKSGSRRWVRLINPADSYLCSSDPRAHFGLGSADRVDAVEVLWPDGTEESFGPFPVDRMTTLRQGQGRPLPTRPNDGGPP